MVLEACQGAGTRRRLGMAIVSPASRAAVAEQPAPKALACDNLGIEPAVLRRLGRRAAPANGAAIRSPTARERAARRKLDKGSCHRRAQRSIRVVGRDPALDAAVGTQGAGIARASVYVHEGPRIGEIVPAVDVTPARNTAVRMQPARIESTGYFFEVAPGREPLPASPPVPCTGHRSIGAQAACLAPPCAHMRERTRRPVRRTRPVASLIRAPADNLSGRIQSAAVARACCDFCEGARWRAGLSVIIGAPTGHAAVPAQATGVHVAGGKSHERARVV